MSGEIQEYTNSVQGFLQLNNNRYHNSTLFEYTSSDNKLTHKLLLPDRLDSKEITPVFQAALDRNAIFFGSVPVAMNLLLLEKTDDWNFFFPAGRSHKTKGDRFSGFVSGNTIVSFTQQGLAAETNALTDNKDPKQYWEDLIAHETAHAIMLTLNPQSNQTKWFWEGIPMYVGNAKHKIGAKQELYDILAQNQFLDQPPPDTFLADTKYPGNLGKHEIAYEYGQWFIEMIIKSMNGNTVPVVNMLKTMHDGKSLQQALEEVTHKSYDTLYKEFLTYLQA